MYLRANRFPPSRVGPDEGQNRVLSSGSRNCVSVGFACRSDAELGIGIFGRIFTAMGLSPGAVVADIGTGPDPIHVLRMVKLIGSSGRWMSSELWPVLFDSGKLAKQPRLGHLPVTQHGFWRDFEVLSRFFYA